MSTAVWILSAMMVLLPSASARLPSLAFVSTSDRVSASCRTILHRPTRLFVGMQWDDPLFNNATTVMMPSVGVLVMPKEQNPPRDNFLKLQKQPLLKKKQEPVKQPLYAITAIEPAPADKIPTPELGSMFNVGITAMNGLLVGGIIALSLLSPAPAEKAKAHSAAMAPTKEQQQRIEQNKASRERFLKEQQDLEDLDTMTAWNSGGFYF
jgi:hypothetical protein